LPSAAQGKLLRTSSSRWQKRRFKFWFIHFWDVEKFSRSSAENNRCRSAPGKSCPQVGQASSGGDLQWGVIRPGQEKNDPQGQWGFTAALFSTKTLD